MPPPQISPFLRDCIVHDDAGDSGINADALTRKGRAFPGLRMTGPAAVDYILNSSAQTPADPR
jgi:hypothetical protein